MKPEQLQDAIGEVRDDYVRDAHAVKKTTVWIRYAAIAACLALILAAIPIALSLHRETPPVTAPKTIPVTVETTAATESTTTTTMTDPSETTTAATTAKPTTVAHVVTMRYATCLTAGLTPQTVTRPDKNSGFTAAMSDFSLRLALETCDGNSVISPLSIYAALAMAESGATDKTLEEFEKTLGIKSDALDREMAALLRRLKGSDELSMVNSVWVSDQYAEYVKPEYLQRIVDCYSSDVFSFDSGDPGYNYVNDANHWISDQTKGRVDKLLEAPSSSDDVAAFMLLNALTYDNTWAMKRCNNPQMVFYNADGTRKKYLPSLHYDSKGNAYNFPFLQGNTFNAFFVPYENGDWFVGFSPKFNKNVVGFVYYTPQEILQDLLSVGLDTYLSEKTVSSEIIVSIDFPLFTEETRCDLTDSLKTMGLSRALTPLVAQFYRIATPPVKTKELSIGGIYTKSRFELTEEGVKAAAGSAVVLRTIRGSGATAAPPNIQIKLDHPFVYMVLDSETDLPLFIGTRDHF